MLAFTRKAGDSFTIGDDITITVVRVDQRGNVRLTVDAPRDLSITRHDAKVRTRQIILSALDGDWEDQ